MHFGNINATFQYVFDNKSATFQYVFVPQNATFQYFQPSLSQIIPHGVDEALAEHLDFSFAESINAIQVVYGQGRR